MKEACDGDWMLLECPKDHKITPVGVFYGRSLAEKCLPPDRDNYKEYEYAVKRQANIPYCRYDTIAVYSRIRERCLNRRICSFEVGKELLTSYGGIHREKCPENVKTYLRVQYICDDRAKRITSYKCANEVFEPKCPKGQLINIRSTFRGRFGDSDAKCANESLKKFQGQ